jgi:hypothetical protein
MKVKDLIAILEDCNPDADVLLASQPNWPFEYALRGVAVRESMEEREQDEEDAPAGSADGGRPSDVLLVEGQQLRYGSRAAWDVARSA